LVCAVDAYLEKFARLDNAPFCMCEGRNLQALWD
jgi:hypothetical protein